MSPVSRIAFWALWLQCARHHLWFIPLDLVLTLLFTCRAFWLPCFYARCRDARWSATLYRMGWALWVKDLKFRRASGFLGIRETILFCLPPGPRVSEDLGSPSDKVSWPGHMWQCEEFLVVMLDEETVVMSSATNQGFCLVRWNAQDSSSKILLCRSGYTDWPSPHGPGWCWTCNPSAFLCQEMFCSLGFWKKTGVRSCMM